jgi:hypothetical protein
VPRKCGGNALVESYLIEDFECFFGAATFFSSSMPSRRTINASTP